MTPRNAYIALNMMPGIGPVKVRGLIECLGSVEAIFTASPNELMQGKGIGQKLCDNIISQRERINPRHEEEDAHELGAKIITIADEAYPKALKEIHDPPMALYVRGDIVERDQHAVAVVGSRNCSHYGTLAADRLSYGLSSAGYTVISGLARGIDTSAHLGALKGKGRTIAVLGSALDELYPTENEELAERIVKQGAVISEFPLGTKPGRTTFPMRNRIITGLSLGTLVVEAGMKSGAMISVDEATAQGRLIFAVPGRIDNKNAQGCHFLIKNGAKLVESFKDITDEFEYLFTPETKPAERPKPKLNEVETRVMALLETAGGMDVDTLIREGKLDPARVNGVLIGLEMKRMIKVLPGRFIDII